VGSGLYRITREDGDELTTVPGADARFLQVLDGRRSVREAWELVHGPGSGARLTACLALARTYLRAGALHEVDRS
jgi:hypothetical protein